MNVLVAMSGGVDSSVAAALMAEQGHSVTGVYLRNGVAPGRSAARGKQGCCGVADAHDAARVADRLGIPFYSLDFAEGFDALIDGFADAYADGRTPNPCIDCNRDLKFGRLLRYADALGADLIATGHYAERLERNGRHALRRPLDDRKDQTYVLFPLDQHQLARTTFPLARLTKDEVRRRARDLDLRVADKPESMEICFVPGGDYRAVVAARRPDALRPGPIVDASTGAVVGTHAGVGGVTLGQRRGLGLAGGGPARFVTAVDASSNAVYVGDAEQLERREVIVHLWNAVSAPAPSSADRLRGHARVRRNHAPQPAEVRAETGPGGIEQMRVAFDPPVRSPAPGQALVLYDDDGYVLGGGVIASSVA